MADMESLEDMLAALEGPSAGDLNNDLDSISNIDEFLDQIEEEARMSTKTRQNGDEYGYVAQQGRPQVSHSQPQRAVPTQSQQGRYQQQQQQQQPQRAQAPVTNQQVRQPAQSNAQPARQPAPSHAQPARQPAPSNVKPVRQPAPVDSQPSRQPAPSNASVRHGGGASDAIAELQAQGYEKHNNPGKWINYTGGKATDFRIKGTTSTRVGLAHVITLRALDDYGSPARVDNPRDFIGCVLTHQQSGANMNCWYRDNGNCEYDLAFCPDKSGSVRMEIKLAGNPMFDIEIQVEDFGMSVWVAKPRLPAKPKELFVIDIETADGSRPEGVAPFEVQTVGSVENLRLINNGDGTYRFQCVPQCHGHVTIQLTLHGQPIKHSPVTVQVGDRQPMKIRQESSHVETISDTRPAYNQDTYDIPPAGVEDYGNDYDQYNGGGGAGAGAAYGYQPRDSTNVSNEDLNRLLDELGG